MAAQNQSKPEIESMRSAKLAAHIAAFFTIIAWGITFISTKILLRDFTPMEILFSRFFIGWLALWAMCPRWLPFSDKKRELLFCGAGFFGVTLYFLLENVALTLSFASNVGVIVTMAPFFTAMLAWPLLKRGRPGTNFFAGFFLAMAGISLISFNGKQFSIQPMGDFLALLAALAWAFYSIFTRKLGMFGLGSLLVTRRIFFYGLLFMPPCMWRLGFSISTAELLEPLNLLNLLFLGLVASAICFASWTFAIKGLGVVKTSIYIYLVPVVTMGAAALILHEPLTPMSICGALLAITGLFVGGSKRFGQ